MQKPFPQSYWVREGLLCAGHYPGSLDSAERTAKLTGLLDCGIRRVINLIPANETGSNGEPFSPYQALLQEMAAQRGLQVECLRMGYPDGTTPARSQMSEILDTIDASFAALDATQACVAFNEPLYLHCWGGHGRTGTTVACYLIRHGQNAQAAIDQILAWRKPLPRNHFPFEGRQEDFVRSWKVDE